MHLYQACLLSGIMWVTEKSLLLRMCLFKLYLLKRRPKIFSFHGNMDLVKLQVAYHMSVLGWTFPQARKLAADTTGWTFFFIQNPFILFFSPQISISQPLICSWLIMLICVNISAVMMHFFSAKNKTWANKITSRFNRSTKQQVLFKQYICDAYKWQRNYLLLKFDLVIFSHKWF